MTRRHTFKVKRVWLIVLILCFALSASGCELNAEFKKTVQLSKSLEPGRQFEAGTHNGSIGANGIETRTCEISATITGKGPTVEDAEKVAENIKIKLEYMGDKLVAHIDKPEWLEQRYYSIDYNIQLPSTTSLEFSTHNGSIKVGNINGALHLSTHNGGIDCYDVSGKVNANTHNGSVKVHYVNENVNPMDTNISTHNGSIEIKAPDKLSAELNASTHNGAIEVSKPVTVIGRIDKNSVRGRIGTGQGILNLRTHNGAITVR